MVANSTNSLEHNFHTFRCRRMMVSALAHILDTAKRESLASKSIRHSKLPHSWCVPSNSRRLKEKLLVLSWRFESPLSDEIAQLIEVVVDAEVDIYSLSSPFRLTRFIMDPTINPPSYIISPLPPADSTQAADLLRAVAVMNQRTYLGRWFLVNDLYVLISKNCLFPIRWEKRTGGKCVTTHGLQRWIRAQRFEQEQLPIDRRKSCENEK